MNLPFAALGLPVEETLPSLKNSLTDQNIAILEAPPGAGKTTLVPLALLNERWLDNQKIIMLEPRRLAARTAAQRMANLLGEKVGQTVGYRVRQDKKISQQTRIEVVTEGILTRQLQSDPELQGVGLVIFDEFHERNLQGDLGLALCLEALEALRDDLRLLVMSATLNGEVLSTFLNNAPRITSKGRAFAVRHTHLPRPDKFNLPHDVAKAVSQALSEETGNILAFLPGEREIKQTQRLLEDTYKGRPNLLIYPLYGALKSEDQDRAIAPPPEGHRKIVLATTIAETSLTIEGVRVVVDCGLKRVPRFDSARGFSKLETVRISKASAEQRSGRAGRLSEGHCYRLWPEAEMQALSQRDTPEILEADLAPFVLEMAQWGVSDIHDLSFLDYPSDANLQTARELLRQIRAIDDDGRLTRHGRAVMSLSLHPRLAHMVLCANESDPRDGALACQIAAILQENMQIKGAQRADIRDRLSALEESKPPRNVTAGVFYRTRQTVKDLKKRLKIGDVVATPVWEAGRILALAYPERIAKQRQPGQPAYLMSNAKGATLRDDDPLQTETFLSIAELGGTQAQPVIFSAAPISQNEIETLFESDFEEVDQIAWHSKKQSVEAKHQTRYGAVVLKSVQLKNVTAEQLQEALCDGIRKTGLQVLPWTKEATNLKQRILFLNRLDDWPDMTEQGLLDQLEDWLGPYLNGLNKLEQLKTLNLEEILLATLDWNQQQDLNRLAPTHYTVPSGSHIRLDYSNLEKPVLAVKLQEMFGEPQTPYINNGQTALQIHLLSPAGRALQVTDDLTSFWKNAYDSVKKEMRGRYPKHPWPDNPLQAVATRKTKRHL